MTNDDKGTPGDLQDRLDASRIHPAIAALEKAGEAATLLEGFLGTGDKGAVRLYEALSLEAYVEMARDAVLHVDDDGFEPGAVRAFVKSSAQILVVRSERLAAANYRQGPPGPVLPPLVPVESFWTCAAKCETTFASRAAAILIDETGCLRHPDELRQAACLQAIEQRKHQAKEALWACLERCAATHGTPLAIGGRFSLGAYYSQIVARHLERSE